ncbi:MAG: hypothetical protein ACJAZX_000874 [Rickettsiales bacterium]
MSFVEDGIGQFSSAFEIFSFEVVAFKMFALAAIFA